MLLKVINVSSVMCVSLASFIIEEENQSFFFLFRRHKTDNCFNTLSVWSFGEKKRRHERGKSASRSSIYSAEAKYVFISVDIPNDDVVPDDDNKFDAF